MRCFCDQREQKYGRGASRAPNRISLVIRPDDRREESAAWLEFKKYFSINFILTGFLFNNYKFVFLFWILGRGVRGECPKFKTPYSLQIKGKKEGV